MKYSLVSFFCFLVALPSIAQQEKPNLPWIDLSAQKDRQLIIAEGTPELYNGHPTTILFDDNRTMLCTWSYGHGGKASFIAESKDAGLTWKNSKTPADWQTMNNCPSIYRLTDKQGKERVFVFCADPKMGQSYSEDKGNGCNAEIIKTSNHLCS